MPTIQTAGTFPLPQTGNQSTYMTGEGCTLHIYGYAVDLTVNKEKHHVHEGDAALVPPHTGAFYDAPRPTNHFCFHFRYDAEALKQMVPGFTIFTPSDLPTLLDDCRKVERDWKSNSNWRRRGSRGGLHQLLCGLWAEKENNQRPTLHKSFALAQMVRDLIETNPSQPIRVGDLANHLGRSSDYLTRCFKQHYGVSIQKYALQRRLETARYLVEQSDIPLKAIAADTGFHDLQHLSRRFREHFGCTPGSLRPTPARRGD